MVVSIRTFGPSVVKALIRIAPDSELGHLPSVKSVDPARRSEAALRIFRILMRWYLSRNLPNQGRVPPELSCHTDGTQVRGGNKAFK